MKFGLPEIKEFAENHSDERIRIMYAYLCEARSKNAKWCEALAEATSTIRHLIEKDIQINGDNKWNDYGELDIFVGFICHLCYNDIFVVIDVSRNKVI